MQVLGIVFSLVSFVFLLPAVTITAGAASPTARRLC